MQPISLAITHFNRFPMVMESFLSVINNPIITEIIISDDCSTDGSYEKLKEAVKEMPKVRLLRNFVNIQMGANKMKAISECNNDFVAIIDSDNKISDDYIYSLEKEGELKKDTIYCPQFAKPDFNFRHFAGRTFDKFNIRELAEDSMGNVSMNTSNYIVPKDEYVRVYKHNPEMKATDTVYFALLWLRAGNKFHIVKGMEYDHRKSEDSGFLKDCAYNMQKAAELRKQIIAL